MLSFNFKRYITIGLLIVLLSSIQGYQAQENNDSLIPQSKNTEIIFTMDFDEEWTENSFDGYLSPPGWTIQGITSGHQENNRKLTHYWSRVDKDFSYTHTLWESSPISQPYVYSGDGAAFIWGNDGNQESAIQSDRSDEWLISPTLDFSSYYNIELSFWSIYAPTQRITLPFPLVISVDNQYLFKTSNDDGTTWKKNADLRTDSYKFGVNNYLDVYNKYDEQINIDLDQFRGQDDIRLAWNYLYNGNGTSDLWVIDDIQIHAQYDSFAPDIEIVKPKKDNLYILDATVIPMSGKTIVIGPVDIVVDPTDEGTGTKSVEFYKDNTLVYTDTEYPFSWNWKQLGFGSSTIKTVAYDYAGNSNQDQITLFKIF